MFNFAQISVVEISKQKFESLPSSTRALFPDTHCFSQSDCELHGNSIMIMYTERVTRDLPFVPEIRLDAV